MSNNPKQLIGLGAPDTRLAHACNLLDTSRQLASLRVPASMPHRDTVIQDLAFVGALEALINAAQGSGARILSGIALVTVERGRTAEMPYSDILQSAHVAFMEAIEAHAENEAELPEQSAL